MMINTKQSGFSAVELLITLFVAAAFLMAGYQLYSMVVKDGGEARKQSIAYGKTRETLQSFKVSPPNPCSVAALQAETPTTVTGLSNVTIAVDRYCPFGTSSQISRIQVTLKYGNPQKTIMDSTYVSI
ncbi:prepilin-type N-terminal cleavage/methylation domain-containing protein [Candidatus Saccharibacteria bacterium]|nr:prepilin-type N-terminal cleavage/methylation domain-containing protein [Candidatus Saccharibacteria bacterium]